MKRALWCLVGASVSPCLLEAIELPAVTQDTTSVIRGDRRFDDARKKIRDKVDDGSIASLAVAVAVDGKIIWQEAFGWADKENRVLATPHSMYGVGSISKTYTATGLMRLVERGLVDLDRPVNDYLGRGKVRAFVGDAQQATVRLVLSHRAGLPLHHQMFYADEGYGRPTMDETILRYGILVTPPGERYQYANLDYGIVDHIIERVSGRPYETFMDTDVFAPLGLTRTYVLVPPDVRPETVTLYDARGHRVPYFDFDQRGGGAVFSSMYDLVRFGMFHLKNRSPNQRPILADSTLELMRRPLAPVRGLAPGGNYAMGWGISDDQFGHRVVAHSGGMLGGATDLRLVPDKNIVVAVASNTRHDLTYGIAGDILAALLPDYKERWLKRPLTPSPPPSSPPGKEYLGEWQGEIVTWQKAVPITLTFQPDGDVHVKLGNQLATLLNDVRVRDGDLSGTFDGVLTPPDIARHPHRLQLMNLRLRDGTLGGAVLAFANTDRSHFGLPSWIWLKRK